jgi:putative peptidoglycan lipid II flippase
VRLGAGRRPRPRHRAGLATDAALAQRSSDDPEGDDVVGLGRLLYACLVARWPGGPESGLSAAPTENGKPLRPRQVRAGVPRPLDALCAGIICRSAANGGRRPNSARAVSTALAAALDALVEPVGSPAADRPAPALLAGVLPSTTEPVEPTTDSGTRTTADLTAPPAVAAATAAHEPSAGTTVQQVPVLPPAGPHLGSSAVPGGPVRSWRSWLLWLAVAVLVVGAGLLAYQLGRSGAPSATDAPDRAGSPTSSGPSTEPLEPLPVSAVADFDPVADGGNGEENPDLAPLAVDRDPQTAWTTVTYFDKRPLGGQKPGIGLVLDLGSPVPVRELEAALAGTGTNVQLRAAPRTAATVPTTAADFTTVASVQDAGSEAVFRLSQPVTTRYLLIYLTALPLVSPGNYQGGVADVAVRG